MMKSKKALLNAYANNMEKVRIIKKNIVEYLIDLDEILTDMQKIHNDLSE